MEWSSQPWAVEFFEGRVAAVAAAVFSKISWSSQNILWNLCKISWDLARSCHHVTLVSKAWAGGTALSSFASGKKTGQASPVIHRAFATVSSRLCNTLFSILLSQGLQIPFYFNLCPVDFLAHLVVIFTSFKILLLFCLLPVCLIYLITLFGQFEKPCLLNIQPDSFTQSFLGGSMKPAVYWAFIWICLQGGYMKTCRGIAIPHFPALFPITFLAAKSIDFL